MTRIYVTEIDTESDQYDHHAPDHEQPRAHAGFFTLESATYWHGNKEAFDGANLADVNTRDQNRGQGLYLTKGGRWVLNDWSNWQGETERYGYTSPDDARLWLEFNSYDDAVREHFGEIEDERSPGRPEIGAPVQVRLGNLLPRVDEFASEGEMSRAQAVRQLVAHGLNVMSK